MQRNETRRVLLLDPLVVGQIAAGEVIERPASVVRELLDNALDAGARHIVVEVEGGGRRRIEVRDDGAGIAGADLELALARHATSKLRKIDDLMALRTLGFRGEGLSSIAAVSRLTLLSRHGREAAAHRLRATGGQLSEVEPAAREVGTTVEVGDLFYNTPARLKFLKSTATELGHIQEVVTRAALAAPSARFSLRVEGREVLELTPARSRLQRVSALWGPAAAPRAGRRAAGSLVAEVFVAPVDQSRSSARAVHSLVNQRPVRDRLLLQAVTRGCGPQLAARRYPRAVVFVECDPELVDVNVHPQKHEVRFADPAEVFSVVVQAVAAALGEDVPRVGRPSVDPRPGAAPPPAKVYALGAATPGGAVRYQDHQRRLEAAAQRFWAAHQAAAGEARLDYGLGAALSRALPPVEHEALVDGTPRLLGRGPRDVLICELDGELFLVSEAAARRELARRRLRQAVDAPPRPLRESLAFAPREPARWSRHRDALAALGFELEAFGASDWLLRATPAPLGDDEQALRALLAAIEQVLVAADVRAAIEEVVVRHLALRLAVRGDEELVGDLGAAMRRGARTVSLDAASRPGTDRRAALALRLDLDAAQRLLEPRDG